MNIVPFASIVMKILSGCCIVISLMLVVIIIVKNIKMKDISKNEKKKDLWPYIAGLIVFLILATIFYVTSKPYEPNVEIVSYQHKLGI